MVEIESFPVRLNLESVIFMPAGKDKKVGGALTRFQITVCEVVYLSRTRQRTKTFAPRLLGGDFKNSLTTSRR